MSSVSCVVTRAQFLARCPLANWHVQPKSEEVLVPDVPLPMDDLQESKLAPPTNGETFTPPDSELVSHACSDISTSCPLPPPGLVPPPGLAAPPGLELAGELQPATVQAPVEDSVNVTPSVAHDDHFQVLLKNIPNLVMQDTMLRTMLQQARLTGAVASFTTSPGDKVGEVTLAITSAEAAWRCLHHFHGCTWGEFAPVTAELLPVPNGVPKVLSADAPSFVLHSTLSAYAPAFVLPTSALSANAPVFVLGSKVDDKGSESNDSTADTASEHWESDVTDWVAEPVFVAA